MEELEFTEPMMKRSDVLDDAVYQMCVIFLQLNEEDDAAEKFPWNVAVLQEIREGVLQVLRKHGYKVCDPYIDRNENQGSKFCETKECGKETCILHS